MKVLKYINVNAYLKHIFFFLIVICVIAACATNKKESANLTQISHPFRLLKPGFSYLQHISGTGASRDIFWVFKGKEGKLFRWDLFQNRDTTGEPWRVQWYNSSGSSVRQRQAKATANWNPHNCFRVLGECSFVYSDDFGIASEYVRKSSFNGKNWVYQLYRVVNESHALVTRGEARFDVNGIEIFHEYFTSNNGHQLSKVTAIHLSP